MFDNIYMIYSSINNNFYVGKTEKIIDIRYKRHMTDAKKITHTFHIIMHKIGLEHWKVVEFEKVAYDT